MDIKTEIPQEGEGGFYLLNGTERIGEMIAERSGGQLLVYHTEISEAQQGKDLGKKLLSAMVDYARSNNLKVVPYCPYVLAQFKRHPEYADIWSKDEISMDDRSTRE